MKVSIPATITLLFLSVNCFAASSQALPVTARQFFMRGA
jgi:hypothetical protein